MVSMDGERLSPRHRAELKRSAISEGQIAARGYETISRPRALPPEFTGDIRKGSGGLLIPVWTTRGAIGTYQYKPDNPPLRDGKIVKYVNPAGGNVCLDVPAAARPFLDDVEADLWITEGAKKVDSAVSNGIPCIVGLLGVAMWSRAGMALPDWKDIALQGRRVIIAFDSDVMTKPAVRRQLDSLAGWLRYGGASVGYCLLSPLKGAA
jgi:hypothetical protein